MGKQGEKRKARVEERAKGRTLRARKILPGLVIDECKRQFVKLVLVLPDITSLIGNGTRLRYRNVEFRWGGSRETDLKFYSLFLFRIKNYIIIFVQLIIE